MHLEVPLSLISLQAKYNSCKKFTNKQKEKCHKKGIETGT